MNDSRQQRLERWSREQVQRLTGADAATWQLSMVSGDASFRHYYRLAGNGQSYIVADAPPQQEDSKRFVAIARKLRDAGIMAPAIHATDFDQGFLLLEDFGDELYLDYLKRCRREKNLDAADRLYGQAITALVTLQKNVDSKSLDPYDRDELHSEMSLFDEWFCREFLQMDLKKATVELIEDTYGFLESAALRQTQVAVHRDYHSRNLLLLDPRRFDSAQNPGVVDFQDAVRGAYTYDLVSLLRDCYINWPPEQVRRWAQSYLEQAKAAGIVTADMKETVFLRDFDRMGLQRHLKVMGIFARLALRDKKTGYLADIPLVIHYFQEVAAQQPEMTEFLGWFNQQVLPRAAKQLKLDH